MFLNDTFLYIDDENLKIRKGYYGLKNVPYYKNILSLSQMSIKKFLTTGITTFYRQGKYPLKNSLRQEHFVVSKSPLPHNVP